MDELELYLALVRRQLRVGRRRAEAICTELRSHLEAQALQFERGGMSREQAVARAVARFGAPNEIAKRLVASNREYRREDFLKAMWLGLIAGVLVFYAWSVALYLMHLQSIHGVTTYWRMNLAMGGGIGGLSGLAAYALRARLGTIARVLTCIAGLFWIGFIARMYALGGFADHSLLGIAGNLLMGGPFTFGIVATALAGGYAVNRWVLAGSTARPAQAKRPR